MNAAAIPFARYFMNRTPPRAVRGRPMIVAALALAVASASLIVALPLWTAAYALAAAVLAWVLHRRRVRRRWPFVAAGGLVAAAVIVATLSWSSGDFIMAALVCGAWLKLVESRTVRDCQVVLLLGLVIMAYATLETQSGIAAIALIVHLTLVVAALIDLHGGGLGTRRSWQRTAALMALSLPLMAALFVFFPRITGSLFDLGFALGLPTLIETTEEKQQPALSDTLSLGDIASRGGSDSRVMAVTFHEGIKPFFNGVPPRYQLYWRGPVLWRYDGVSWHGREGWEKRSVRMKGRFNRVKLERDLIETGILSAYMVRVLPHNSYWLYALDIPAMSVPSAFVTRDYQLVNMNPVRETLKYNVSSYLEYKAGRSVTEADRALALTMPPGQDPRLRAMAEAWAAELGTGQALVDRTLDYVAKGYEYNPQARLPDGPHRNDRFLFDAKEGHSGHFASAFVLLMRAAGLPARLISGYRGGTKVGLTNNLIVMENNAYVWAEVWSERFGWVRFDPADPYVGPALGAGGGFDIMSTEEEDDEAGAEDGDDEKDKPKSAAKPEDAQAPTGGFVDHSENLDAHVGDEEVKDDSQEPAWTFLNRLWRQWVVDYDADNQVALHQALSGGTTNWQKLMRLAGYTLLAIGAVYGLAWLIWRAVARRLAERRRDPWRRIFESLCLALSRAGLVRADTEGPLELAERVTQRFGDRSEIGRGAVPVLRAYAARRYGLRRGENALTVEAAWTAVRRVSRLGRRSHA